MKNKFYAVTAKCGHVGKHLYYEGVFYERALNAKNAAAIVRNRPRVKHNHKDAILFVEEIAYEDYLKGQENFNTAPYFKCKSRWEQRLVWNEILPFLHNETPMQFEHRRLDKRMSYVGKPKCKRPYKRERLIFSNDNDYDYIVAR